MLTQEQAEKVSIVIHGSGWNDVMKPALQNRARLALKALALTRSERATEFKGQDFDTDDDVLRAVIRDIEWLTVTWDNELAVYEHNRRRDELDRQNSDAPNA